MAMAGLKKVMDAVLAKPLLPQSSSAPAEAAPRIGEEEQKLVAACQRGDSAALHEHDSLALWRAVENRRYLIRATNTGLSSVTDPLGRTSATLPKHEATAAAVGVHLLEITSPYQRFGDTFGWLCVAAAVSLLIWCRRP